MNTQRTKNALPLIAAMLVASAALTLPSLATARTEVDFAINTAPPAPRYEVAPPLRSGFVWAPGHWEWRRHHYIWVGGLWIAERPGFVYAPPLWVMREGRWHYETPHWDARGHDRDHDGVPDRHDRHPDNPRRY